MLRIVKGGGECRRVLTSFLLKPDDRIVSISSAECEGF